MALGKEHYRSTKKLYLMFIGGILSLAAIGCKEQSEKAPDVSGVKISFQTFRFDKDLYLLDTNGLATGLKQLLVKYPDFLNYYLDTVMAYGIHGNYNDSAEGVREGLKTFLSFRGFRRLEDSIMLKYPDVKETDARLKSGFTYLKYYFPNAVIPRVMYVNMGLSNWPAFPVDERTMCIGLDMFLGEQFPYYRSIGVPAYMSTHLRSNYIPVALFSAWYKATRPFKPEDKTLLELMVERGKEQYFLHKVLTGTPDSVLFGYSDAQVEWCNQNEGLIYNYFIHEKLLYSKETQRIQPFVFDGPSTPGIPVTGGKISSAPGNLGSWLGYKIVSAYMSQQKGMTLQGLTEDRKDAATVLEEARYRPK